MSVEGTQRRIQLITLGDHKVGKTSMLKRYSFNKFNYETYPTIGVDFVSKKVTIDSHPVLIKIWDTAGQDRFHTITYSFYKHCQGVLLVFDVGSKESLNNVHAWIENIEANAEEQAIKYLIGNKIDCEQREVTAEEAKRVAYKYGMKYYEVSAKMGENVDAAITSLAEEVYRKLEGSENGSKVLLANKPDRSTGCC
eukprot:TRINITY_DN2440_c0_g2_i3.p1 TRINITY_DN2440_c0_g2~~TRINITY_DN2440_c0_g2_i3.p1  ORF type:complete len:196 (+),score=42.49 TRINITY_DN2440_c0_g2_i3:180-767(+)